MLKFFRWQKYITALMYGIIQFNRYFVNKSLYKYLLDFLIDLDMVIILTSTQFCVPQPLPHTPDISCPIACVFLFGKKCCLVIKNLNKTGTYNFKDLYWFCAFLFWVHFFKLYSKIYKCLKWILYICLSIRLQLQRLCHSS